MSRLVEERLEDILSAIDRCLAYRHHLTSSDRQLAAMSYDAVLRNLAVIGEAVRALPDETTAAMPGIPWAAIAGLRNTVIHEYFRVDPTAITDIVDTELTSLATVIRARQGPSGD